MFKAIRQHCFTCLYILQGLMNPKQCVQGTPSAFCPFVKCRITITSVQSFFEAEIIASQSPFFIAFDTLKSVLQKGLDFSFILRLSFQMTRMFHRIIIYLLFFMTNLLSRENDFMQQTLDFVKEKTFSQVTPTKQRRIFSHLILCESHKNCYSLMMLKSFWQ